MVLYGALEHMPISMDLHKSKFPLYHKIYENPPNFISYNGHYGNQPSLSVTSGHVDRTPRPFPPDTP